MAFARVASLCTLPALMVMANFVNGIFDSLQDPFFMYKKISTEEVEFPQLILVFGLIYNMVSTICGNFLSAYGRSNHRTWQLSVLALALSSFLVGVVDALGKLGMYVPKALIYLVDMMQASGSCVYMTSLLTMVTQERLGKNITAFAVVAAVYGFGRFCGEFLGDLSDFGVVFAFFAVAALFVAIFMLALLQEEDDDETTEESGVGDTNKASMLDVMKCPMIRFHSLCVLAIGTGTGFMTALFKCHSPKFVHPMRSQAFQIGAFMLFAPIFALRLKRNLPCSKVAFLIGHVLTFIPMILVAFVENTQERDQRWVLIIAQCLHGFGSSVLLVSAFADISLEASENGLASKAGADGLICGLAVSVASFGSQVGSWMGGCFLEHIDVSESVAPILAFQLLVFCLISNSTFRISDALISFSVRWLKMWLHPDEMRDETAEDPGGTEPLDLLVVKVHSGEMFYVTEV